MRTGEKPKPAEVSVRQTVRATPAWVKLLPGERILLLRPVRVAGKWGLSGPGTMVLTQERLFLQGQGIFSPGRVRIIPRGLLFDLRPNESRQGWLTIRYADGPETRAIELVPVERGSNSPAGLPMTPAAKAMELADAIRDLQRGELNPAAATTPATAGRPTPAGKPSGKHEKKPPSVAGLAAELVIAAGLIQQSIESIERGASLVELIPGLALLAVIAYHAYRVVRARAALKTTATESGPKMNTTLR